GFLLQDDRALIETVGGPKDAEAGASVAADDGPVDGTGAAVARQQRGMELNHAVARDGGQILGNELQHVGHDAEVHVQRTEDFPGLLRFERCELMHRDSIFLRREPQGVGNRTRFLERAEHPRDAVALGEKGIQHRLAEVPLSNDGYAHRASRYDFPPNPSDISYIIN